MFSNVTENRLCYFKSKSVLDMDLMFFPYCSSSDGSHSLYVTDSFPKALPSKSHAYLVWSPLKTRPQESEKQQRKKLRLKSMIWNSFSDSEGKNMF